MNFILLEKLIKLLQMAAIARPAKEFSGADRLRHFAGVFYHQNNHNMLLKNLHQYFHQYLVETWLEGKQIEVMRSPGWLIWLDRSGRSLQVFAHPNFYFLSFDLSPVGSHYHSFES